jgi:putative redox protein
MEMLIDFPGGARVDAHFSNLTLATDQPVMGGGKGEYPTPYATFLASLGTCAGIYVLGFCQQRGLPTEGITILERVSTNPATGLASEVELDIRVPASFPEKYHDALIRSADQCKVKKQMENPPVFHVHTSVVD